MGLQFFKEGGVRVDDFSTSRNKHHAMNGVAGLLGFFRACLSPK